MKIEARGVHCHCGGLGPESGVRTWISEKGGGGCIAFIVVSATGHVLIERTELPAQEGALA